MGRCFACKTAAAKVQNPAMASLSVSRAETMDYGLSKPGIPLQARLNPGGFRAMPPIAANPQSSGEIPLQRAYFSKRVQSPAKPIQAMWSGSGNVIQCAREKSEETLEGMALRYFSLLEGLHAINKNFRRPMATNAYKDNQYYQQNLEREIRQLSMEDLALFQEFWDLEWEAHKELSVLPIIFTTNRTRGGSKQNLPTPYQDLSKRKRPPAVLENEPPTKKKPGFHDDEQDTSNNYNLPNVQKIPAVNSPASTQWGYGLPPIFEDVQNNSNMPPILNDLQGSMVLDRMEIQGNQPAPQPHLLAATIGNEQLWGAELLNKSILAVQEFIDKTQENDKLEDLYNEENGRLHIRGGQDWIRVVGRMIYNKAARKPLEIGQQRFGSGYPSGWKDKSRFEANNTRFAKNNPEIFFRDLYPSQTTGKNPLEIGVAPVPVGFKFQENPDYHHPRIDYPDIKKWEKKDLSYSKMTELAGNNVQDQASQARNLLHFIKTGKKDLNQTPFGHGRIYGGANEALLTHLLLVEAQKDNTLYLSTVAGLELVAAGKLQFKDLFSEIQGNIPGLIGKGGLLAGASLEKYDTLGMNEVAGMTENWEKYTNDMADALGGGPDYTPPIWAVKHMLLLKKWLEHLAATGAFQVGPGGIASDFEGLVLQKLNEYYGTAPR